MKVTRQGGQIFEPAEVAKGAEVGPFVTIREFAEIHDAVTIRGTEERPALVEGNALMFSGTAISSIISGNLKVGGNPQIIDSIACGRKVGDDARLVGSGLFHFAAIWQRARAYQVIIEEEARVYGDALLDGSAKHFKIGGRSRIDRGVWTRPPRTLAIDDDDYLTESVGGVLVNCAFRDHATWLKIGRRVGKFRGWSPEKIDLALETIRSWQSAS